METQKRIDEAVKELDRATDLMVELAKDKAPIAKEAYYEWSREKRKTVKRRPGRLKRNIKKTERKKSFRVYIDMGTRGAPYGIFQELGFTHWKSGKVYAGHFFMEEALNYNKMLYKLNALDIISDVSSYL